MKKLVAVFILFIAGYAPAETAWIRGNSVYWVRPAIIVTDAGMIFHEPDDALLAVAGYTAIEVPDCSPANRVVAFDPPGIRCKTPVELAAEAQAAAEAAAQEYAAKVAAVAPEAAVFRLLYENHFGLGAITNRSITRDTVEAHFVSRRVGKLLGTETNDTSFDAQDIIALNLGFDHITEVTGDGTIWTFPWDQVPPVSP